MCEFGSGDYNREVMATKPCFASDPASSDPNCYCVPATVECSYPAPP